MAAQPDRGRLVLEDPRALRALAHEVRQHAIALLYAGEELTATQAAARCGISPSAMSYHLRALERWGVVERAEPRQDRRERPWRAAAASLDLQPAADAAPAATAPLLFAIVRELERTLRAFLATPEAGRKSGTVRRGVVRLTVEQAAAMNREVEEVLARYDALGGTSPTDTRWDVFYVALPGEPDADAPRP